MKHYRATWTGLALTLVLLLAAAALSTTAKRGAHSRHTALREQRARESARLAQLSARRRCLESAMAPAQTFASPWVKAARFSEKEAADQIRSEMEAIAQRQLGLVTDNAITPQPEKFSFHGAGCWAQKVTLRASGKDLGALLAWLGKVEERYPAAVIEHCELTSNVGGNTALTLRLVQPLREQTSSSHLPPGSETDLAVEEIAAFPWHRYSPAALKGAVAIGLSRNPLQPVAGDPRSVALIEPDADDLAPKIEAALAGRVRSVIRGVSAIVVVDGRVFRIGDEVTLGPARERPLSDHQLKLKAIGDDRLVFQVVAHAAKSPAIRDVVYALPAFLRCR